MPRKPAGRDIAAEVMAFLTIAGCATAHDLARDLRTTEGAARKALREIGAHDRVIGGSRMRCDGSRINLGERTVEYRLAPWSTASGSTPGPLQTEPMVRCQDCTKSGYSSTSRKNCTTCNGTGCVHADGQAEGRAA